MGVEVVACVDNALRKLLSRLMSWVSTPFVIGKM